MDRVFLTILNMSLTGSFVIVVICLARFPLKKAPKFISYFLWAAAGFRLVFPFSIEGVFSLIPFKAQTIPPDILTQHVPRINSGVTFIDNTISGLLPSAAPRNSVYPLQAWTAIGAGLWLLGFAIMLIYGVMSYFWVKRRIRESVYLEANLIEAENIQSPFVFGIITPKIYIPAGLSLKEREYILLHEKTHIRRHDHIVKFAAFFILCMHWFNPLAWAAFLLMSVDMEMSCDESVLKDQSDEIKKDYSMSLLSLAIDRRVISGSPLAFGENGVKKRIKNVLMFRKPSRIAAAAAIVFVTVLSLGLVASRAGADDSYETQATGADMSHTVDIYVITDFYNDNGKFSDRGLTLYEKNSERMLTVSGGDILVAGNRQYVVTAESLTLSFYTQPSLNQVNAWWTDYLNSWAESGKVKAVS